MEVDPELVTGTPASPGEVAGPAGRLMLLGPISSVLNGVSDPADDGMPAPEGAGAAVPRPNRESGGFRLPPRSASGGTAIEKLGLYNS